MKVKMINRLNLGKDSFAPKMIVDFPTKLAKQLIKSGSAEELEPVRVSKKKKSKNEQDVETKEAEGVETKNPLIETADISSGDKELATEVNL